MGLIEESKLRALFSFKVFQESITFTSYLLSMIRKADGDTRELYKNILGDTELNEVIINHLFEEGANLDITENQRNELIDLKWNVENIDTVDGEKLDVVVVNLKLVYMDDKGERAVKSMICTMDEFYSLLKKFNEICEAL